MTIKYGYRGKRSQYAHYYKQMMNDPIRFFRSYTDKTPQFDITCMLCVYNEQETVLDALRSTALMVDRYIVVDKNGKTLPIIKEFADNCNIEFEYYIKPNLSLRESREFAINKNDSRWQMMIDGDEFLYPEFIDVILSSMNRENIYLRTRKNIILSNRKTYLVNNGYHSFIWHNNGTIRPPDIDIRSKHNDVPVMNGRAKHFRLPVILNNHIFKPTDRKKVDYDPKIQGKLPKEILKYP